MNKKKLNRREFLQISSLAAAGVILASCTSQATETPVPTEEATTAPTATAAPTAIAAPTATTVPTATKVPVKTADELIKAAGLPLPGAPNNTKGWSVKLPAVPDGMPLAELLKINTCATINQTFKFPPGDDVVNNPFTRMIKAVMNIQIEEKWTASSADDFNQKMNMSMATDDMPDIFSSTNLANLVEAGLVQDITDAYEKYASEEYIKKPLRAYGNLPWTQCTQDGKKYGLPAVAEAGSNDKLLWIRQDWLDKLGLTAPKTLDELAEVALAFKKADLGQGAKGTTMGLLANSSFTYAWFGSLDPVWGGFGIIPGYWTEQNGQLVNGVIRSEAKECLALLAKWYKDGVIASDFYTVEQGASEVFIAGNQCGLHYTPYWTPTFGIKESTDNDKTAIWTFNDIAAGPTGIKKKHWTNPFLANFTGISSKFKNVPEYFKFLNWMYELKFNPECRFFLYMGWEGIDFIIENGVLKSNRMDWHRWQGLGPGMLDPNVLLIKDKWIKDNWSKIPESERDAQMNFVLNLDPMQKLYNDATSWVIEHSEEQGIKDLFVGKPTQTMVDKGVELGTKAGDIGTLATKTFIDIITGQKPVSVFDDFVKQWKSLGGDQMTSEVNDWFSKQA
jgi:putative aldouronate transport system substrate-binding protein